MPHKLKGPCHPSNLSAHPPTPTHNSCVLGTFFYANDMGKNKWCYGVFFGVLDTRWTFELISYASCRFAKAVGIFSVYFPRKTDGNTFPVQIGAEKGFPYFFRGNGTGNVERFRRFRHGKCFFRRLWRGQCVFRICFRGNGTENTCVFRHHSAYDSNHQNRLKSAKMQMSMP